MQNAKTPLSYDEILESLNANKTTFYRSIEIFEKKGLVIKTENNHKSYYELANEAKAYFICDVCHKVTNIDMPHLNVAKNIKSAKLMDKIEIHTYTQTEGKATSCRYFEFKKDGELIATGKTEFVYIDLKTNRPKAIPAEIIALYS